MSVILAIDEGDQYKILSDSGRKYSGLMEIRAGKKVYRFNDILVADVGCCSKSQVWHRAAREIHKSFYNHSERKHFQNKIPPKLEYTPEEIIELIIDKASEIGFELYRDFDFSHCRFIKVENKIYYLDAAFYEVIEETYMAIGSGRKYVYGAMDSNQVDPRVAMKIACQRDPSCALPINQIRIDKQTGEINDDGEV